MQMRKISHLLRQQIIQIKRFLQLYLPVLGVAKAREPTGTKAESFRLELTNSTAYDGTAIKEDACLLIQSSDIPWDEAYVLLFDE